MDDSLVWNAVTDKLPQLEEDASKLLCELD
ncbi:hypothetical protein [Salinisphaera aquimarina]